MTGLVGRSPIQASAAASITAKLKGSDPGRLILGILFLLMFGFSLVMVQHTIWAILGILFGIGGLVTLLVNLCLMGANIDPLEGPPAVVAVSGDEMVVSARTRDPEQLVALVRQAVQNRKELPPPHGVVIGDKPENEKALREYSEEEKKEESERINREAIEHDMNILNQLKEVERALPEATEEESKPHNDSTLPS